MPPPKVTDDRLIAGLIGVFRDFGFEGATIARISQATGLEKASLYHRFPGGKEQMAEAALRHVEGLFVSELLAPLNANGSLAARVRAAGERLQRFYEDGRRSCLIETLSVKGPGERVQAAVEHAYSTWRDAFARAAIEAGLSASEARARAEHAIIAIHGTLVLTRATGDAKPFARAIHRLPQLLTQK